MAKTEFDYRGAKEAGYSDEEITQHLSELHPKFDYQGAVEAGYSPEDINEHLSEYKPKKSFVEKAARTAGQYALGAAEGALFPVEIATAVQTSKPALDYEQRKRIGEDLEFMLESHAGTDIKDWPEKDRQKYDYLADQIKPGGELKDQVKPSITGVRSLAEKVTGQDLHPEGVIEKAANWAGFLKNPNTLLQLGKIGLAPKSLLKAIAPTGTEVMRGVGAGAALELAEQGQFGPIGTMGALIAGDLLGGGSAKVVKGAAKLVTNPKETLAKVAARLTPKDKLSLQKDIIKDFRAAGIQADLGSVTDSNLAKMVQTRLSQSGLSGKALQEFREEITSQIKNEYKAVADTLGELKQSTNYEAGSVAKEGLKKIRDADLATTRNFYQAATNSLKQDSYVNSNKIVSAIQNLERNLKPGRLKSSEQQTVLNTLEKLKTDVIDGAGNPIYASVKDLMNNKIALNDIINYEVQGGAKQLLKGLVGELDRAIISHGKDNAKFARNYITANKRFSEHAKTFRNKNVDAMLKDADPAQIMNRMKTKHGINTLKKILDKSPEGKEIFNNMKRLKFEQVVGDNLVDSTSKQVKMGTFSKLLEKGQNREIIKEILSPEAFKRLERLQKNAGRLAEASDKYYNASKSGAAAADAAVLAKGIGDVANILAGNPWPLVKTLGGVAVVRNLSNLLADPKFLRLTEDAILASQKGSQAQLIDSFELLRPYIMQAMQSNQESSPDNLEDIQQSTMQ